MPQSETMDLGVTCTESGSLEAGPVTGDGTGLPMWWTGLVSCRRGSDMNYTLIMKTGESGMVAIGPMSIEYQAAMLRDEIENSSDWTTVGIARVLTEAQARALMNTGQQ